MTEEELKKLQAIEKSLSVPRDEGSVVEDVMGGALPPGMTEPSLQPQPSETKYGQLGVPMVEADWRGRAADAARGAVHFMGRLSPSGWLRSRTAVPPMELPPDASLFQKLGAEFQPELKVFERGEDVVTPGYALAAEYLPGIRPEASGYDVSQITPVGEKPGLDWSGGLSIGLAPPGVWGTTPGTDPILQRGKLGWGEEGPRLPDLHARIAELEEQGKGPLIARDQAYREALEAGDVSAWEDTAYRMAVDPLILFDVLGIKKVATGVKAISKLVPTGTRTTIKSATDDALKRLKDKNVLPSQSYPQPMDPSVQADVDAIDKIIDQGRPAAAAAPPTVTQPDVPVSPATQPVPEGQMQFLEDPAAYAMPERAVTEEVFPVSAVPEEVIPPVSPVDSVVTGFREGESTKALPPIESITDNYTKPLSEYADRIFHETSFEYASEFLPLDTGGGQGPPMNLFFSNKAYQALGQHGKGVLIEFSTEGIEGQINRSKPSWEFQWKQGDVEFTTNRYTPRSLMDNVLSVTVEKGAKAEDNISISRKKVFDRLTRDWVKKTNPDGSVTYTPPKAAVPEASIPPVSPAAKLPPLTESEIAVVKQAAEEGIELVRVEGMPGPMDGATRLAEAVGYSIHRDPGPLWLDNVDLLYDEMLKRGAKVGSGPGSPDYVFGFSKPHAELFRALERLTALKKIPTDDPTWPRDRFGKLRTDLPEVTLLFDEIAARYGCKPIAAPLDRPSAKLPPRIHDEILQVRKALEEGIEDYRTQGTLDPEVGGIPKREIPSDFRAGMDDIDDVKLEMAMASDADELARLHAEMTNRGAKVGRVPAEFEGTAAHGELQAVLLRMQNILGDRAINRREKTLLFDAIAARHGGKSIANEFDILYDATPSEAGDLGRFTADWEGMGQPQRQIEVDLEVKNIHSEIESLLYDTTTPEPLGRPSLIREAFVPEAAATKPLDEADVEFFGETPTGVQKTIQWQDGKETIDYRPYNEIPPSTKISQVMEKKPYVPKGMRKTDSGAVLVGDPSIYQEFVSWTDDGKQLKFTQAVMNPLRKATEKMKTKGYDKKSLPWVDKTIRAVGHIADIGEQINPRIFATGFLDRALISYRALEDAIQTNTVVKMAALRQLGNDVWRVDTDVNSATYGDILNLPDQEFGPNTSLNFNDVLTYPDQFTLNERQQKWVAIARDLLDEDLRLNREAGIDIQELDFNYSLNEAPLYVDVGDGAKRSRKGYYWPRVIENSQALNKNVKELEGLPVGSEKSREKMREYLLARDGKMDGIQYAATPDITLEKTLLAGGQARRDAEFIKFLSDPNNPHFRKMVPEGPTLAHMNVGEHLLPEALSKVYGTPSAPWTGKRWRGVLVTPELNKGLQKLSRDIKLNDTRATKQLQTLNGAIRFLQTGYDTGHMFIQGQIVLGGRPRAWAGATSAMFRALRDPKMAQHKLSQDAAIISEMARSGSAPFLASEFVEASVSGLMSRLPKAQNLAAGFNMFMDQSRIELYRVYRNKALKKYGLDELSPLEAIDQSVIDATPGLARDLHETVKAVDNMSGVSSARQLGVTETRQSIERAYLFYASNYRRAVAGSMIDFFQGGTRGEVARDMQIRALFSATLFFGATAMFLGELGDKANKDRAPITGSGAILYQNDRTIHLFNPTAVAISGVFPFNYRNELNENAIPSGLYPSMIDDFYYRRCWISESRGNEVLQLSPELYIGTTRCSTQVKAI